jgi:hypothetical protein
MRCRMACTPNPRQRLRSLAMPGPAGQAHAPRLAGALKAVMGGDHRKQSVHQSRAEQRLRPAVAVVVTVVTLSDRPGDRPVRSLARASARKRGHRQRDERRDEHAAWHRRTAPALSAEEREAIRATGRQDARRSRVRHWFPERIEDPATVTEPRVRSFAPGIRQASRS